MFKIYTNNENCSYCSKAQTLLTVKNIAYSYIVLDDKGLMDKFPNARTVPQITYQNGNYVGGFDELVEVVNQPKAKKTKTMFNTENTGYLTGEYPLFFGEDLGFVDTINTPYPVLDELYQTQMSQIWNEFEVDLRQDSQP